MKTPMQMRGLKLYAVMAIREGWNKPKYVWEAPSTKRLYIYQAKAPAVRQAKEMNDSSRIGGKCFLQDGWVDRSHNTPKLIEVEWIVVPVWVETMPESPHV